jgi:hypothetical protein
VDERTNPPGPFVSQKEIVQPYLKTSHTARLTNYEPYTLNQSSQSATENVERELLAALSPARWPDDSNTAPNCAEATANAIQPPSAIGQQYTVSATLDSVAAETSNAANTYYQSTVPPGQDTDMSSVNDSQHPKDDEMDCEITLHFNEFLHLNSELQRLDKDLRDKTVALEQRDATIRDRDAEILKLTRDLEFLVTHSSERIRLEAVLAKERDAARKANSDRPLNSSSEGDNENPPKRSRVMQSSTTIPLNLKNSKPHAQLSLYPTIQPQSVSEHRGALHLAQGVEASHRPSSQHRPRTPEPPTKELMKEEKSPKRSLKKKLSDKFLGKKFEAAPPVPLMNYQAPKPLREELLNKGFEATPPVSHMDYHASKPLPAPPVDLGMDGYDATKRNTVTTMDSGYHSLEIPSKRDSVGSIE